MFSVYYSTTQPQAGAGKSSKKKGKKAEINPLNIQLSTINFSSGIADIISQLGFEKVWDMLPDLSKQNLSDISILNRKQRREVEGKLKEHKIKLS